MLRQLALRLMLATLGIAALLAIYAIFDGSQTTWNIVGTSFVLALTIGLMLPCIPRESIARSDLFDRAMIGHLALGGALSIAAIWTQWGGASSTVERLFVLWLFFENPAVIVAVPALRHRRNEDRSLARAETIAFVGAGLSVAVAMASACISTGPLDESAFAAGYSILGGTVVAALSAIGLRAPSSDRFTPPPPPARTDRALGALGLIGAVVATAFALVAVVEDASTTRAMGGVDRFWYASLACASLAVPAAVACVLGLSRARGWMRMIHYVALGATAILGAINAYEATHMLAVGRGWNDPFLERLNLALVVAATASFLASLIVIRINRGHRIASDSIELLAWTCPRCATRSRIAPGEHCCGVCGLAATITLRDDRCPACGYDLRAQPPGVRECPECGRARQMPAAPGA
jgi:hypothetical protein